jgi:hypothetical protein
MHALFFINTTLQILADKNTAIIDYFKEWSALNEEYLHFSLFSLPEWDS